MSFKRTGSKVHNENAVSEVSSEILSIEKESGKDLTRFSDSEDGDVPIPTFRLSPELLDMEMPTLVSSRHDSSSYESNFLTIREVHSEHQEGKLVGRNAKICVPTDDKQTNENKPAMVNQRSESSNFDLMSENVCETLVNCTAESAKEGACQRCTRLDEIVEDKVAKICDLSKRLHDLGQKHKMFIVSNCQLNEANDLLMLENNQLKLEISNIKFQNSQLRSRNEELCRHTGGQESQLLVTRGIGGLSSSSSPNSSYQKTKDGSHPASVTDDLREAISLSCEQQCDVRKLQKQVVSQNETIKALCFQLHRLNERSQKESYTRKRNEGSAVVNSGQEERPASQFQKITSQSDASEKDRRVFQNSISEDYGNFSQEKEVSNDDDIYNRAEHTLHFPAVKTKSQSETRFLAPNGSSQTQNKDEDVENKSSNSRLIQSSRIGNNTQQRNPTLQPSAPSNTEVPSGKAPKQTMHCEDEPYPTETVWCPLCGKEFRGSGREFKNRFEKHIQECSGFQDRTCPICYKLFLSSVSQNDFELHVNNHLDFNVDFEVLEP